MDILYIGINVIITTQRSHKRDHLDIWCPPRFYDNTNTSAVEKLRCFCRRTAAVSCCLLAPVCNRTPTRHALEVEGRRRCSLQQAKQCTLLHCLCSLQCQLIIIIIKKHQAIVIPRLLSSDSTPLPNSQSDLCFHHGDVKSIPQINALEGTRTTCAMDSHIILHAGATEPGMARTSLSMVLPCT